MKKSLKFIFLLQITFLVLLNTEIFAQSSLLLESYIRNKYIARGVESSRTPTFEGSLTYSLSDFNAGVWGIFSMDNTYSEIDFTVEYNKDNFRMSFIDYFSPSPVQKINYFDMTKYKSCHTLDIILFYRLKGPLPFGFKWSSYVLGGDYNSQTSKRMYSSYFETSYLYNQKHFDLNLFAGLVPWESWNSSKTAIVHCGFSIEKNLFTFQKISFPMVLNLIYNPTIREANVSLIIGVKKEYKFIKPNGSTI